MGEQADCLRTVLNRAAAAANQLERDLPERQRELLSTLLDSIKLCPDSILIEIKRSGLAAALAEMDSNFQPPAGVFGISIPVQLKRRGVEAKLIMLAARVQSSPQDPKLVAVIADAHRWIDDLAAGQASSVRDLARRNGRDPGEVSRTLPLAFLAPDIVEAIREGRQPIELTPRKLKRIGTLPLRWADQRRSLGFREPR